MTKYFIDTADFSEIERIARMGVLDGVTTNPKILANTEGDIDLKELVRKIQEVVPGPVSLEVTTNDYEEMVKQAKELSEYDRNVAVKLPLNEAGLRACHTLTEDGIKTNMTAIMNTNQAMLAAKAGATFASIFYGRIKDLGYWPGPVIRETRDLFDQGGLETEIIVGSIRHHMDIHDASSHGAHIITIPPQFFEKMTYHPQTERTINEFLSAYNEKK